MSTTIINLYGGPGTGKSTSAGYIYYLLKSQNVNAELVREYVKDWAWEGRKISVYDQIYFMGKQLRRESLLYGKVDYIVTDSPISLGCVYAERYSPPAVKDGVVSCTKALYKQAAEDGYKHVHVFLQRSKPYNPSGRYQTESDARMIDDEVKSLLDRFGMPYVTCGTETKDLEQFVKSLRSQEEV